MSGKEREEMGRKLLDVLEERHSLSRGNGVSCWKTAAESCPERCFQELRPFGTGFMEKKFLCGD